MRGNLPGSKTGNGQTTKKENLIPKESMIQRDNTVQTENAVKKAQAAGRERKVKGYDEAELLLTKEHTCPVCELQFKTRTPKMSKVIKERDDLDLRPKYGNLDVVKYQVVECPGCGFADLERDFANPTGTAVKLFKTQGMKTVFNASRDEGVREYSDAFKHYKSAIRCNMICASKKGKRGYTMLMTAWLLRGWREEAEMMGETIRDTDIYSTTEEKKLLKYAAMNFLEAESTEDFPIYGINESTFDYLLAALLYETGDIDNSSRLVLRALHNKELKPVYRIKAEDLRDMLKKLRQG